MKRLVGIIFIIGMIGCKKEKETDAWCEGFLNQYYQYASFYSDPLEDLNKCNAILKWDNSQVVFEKKKKIPGGIVFSHEIPLFPTHKYTLEIISENFGKSSGSIFLPESLIITYPHSYDTLPIGDVEIKWQAKNADFYDLFIHIDAYDSSGWISHEWFDTIITTTSFKISSSHFKVPGALYYGVGVYAYSYSGDPYHANMKGDFKGYLFGEGPEDYVYFHVGKPLNLTYKISPRFPKFEERIEKIRKIIERVKKG
jgi:hypothetical protein